MRAARKGASAALLVLALAGGGKAAAGFALGPLRALLPADGEAPGWTREGAPQEFEGEDLYTYIDGGAEIYQEYGFRRVVVQDYKNARGKEVSLEIFEMETPAAAFGMFAYKRSGNGRPVARGDGAELEAYYMNFWKGRFMVTLTGFDEAAETVGGLEAVAAAVDSRLKGAGRVPAIVEALPGKGLRQGSVKYLKGVLGLNNVYPFYTARGLNFREGARGVYDSGATLIILDYGSADARADAWAGLCAFLEDSDRFEEVAGGGPDVPMMRDGKGQYVFFAWSGPRLLIGIGPGPAIAREAVGRVR